MPQKAIKGQAVTSFLVDHPVSGTSKLYDNLPDEIGEVNLINSSSEEQVWQLFFDGASRTNLEGNTITCMGVVLISPHNYVIPHAFSLTELCSNNVSEYNALLIGMQLAKEIRVKNLEAYGDSKSSSTKFARSMNSEMRLSAISQRDHYHGREVWKLSHWPYTTTAKSHVDALASLTA